MDNFAETLLIWYDRNHRELPWRVSPTDKCVGVRPDPYHVWLSEIMLQQTTVQTVKPYFAKFLARWPNIEDLANAQTEHVMAAWAGLGYYARARNLKKCAEALTTEHGGRFPEDFDGLKALPGIGEYTAAAISAIAFDQPEAVVDGNVERVITRLFTIETPLPAAKPEIRIKTKSLTPLQRPGDFAQAMMDLGATVCTPKRPTCALCPFNGECRALEYAEPERFPFKLTKPKRPIRCGAAFIAETPQATLLLRTRKENGLLGGMAEVPTTNWTARIDGATGLDAAPFVADWKRRGEVTHIFTHFELRLSIWHTTTPEQPVPGGRWEKINKLDEKALPTVMKKAISAAIPNAFKTNEEQGKS